MPNLRHREELPFLSTPRNAETENAVIANLREAAIVSGNSVRCECRGGTLVLSGTVPSYYHKQLAQERAGQVDGVSTIDNQIRVDSVSNSSARLNA